MRQESHRRAAEDHFSPDQESGQRLAGYADNPDGATQNTAWVYSQDRVELPDPSHRGNWRTFSEQLPNAAIESHGLTPSWTARLDIDAVLTVQSGDRSLG